MNSKKPEYLNSLKPLKLFFTSTAIISMLYTMSNPYKPLVPHLSNYVCFSNPQSYADLSLQTYQVFEISSKVHSIKRYPQNPISTVKVFTVITDNDYSNNNNNYFIEHTNHLYKINNSKYSSYRKHSLSRVRNKTKPLIDTSIAKYMLNYYLYYIREKYMLYRRIIIEFVENILLNLTTFWDLKTPESKRGCFYCLLNELTKIPIERTIILDESKDYIIKHIGYKIKEIITHTESLLGHFFNPKLNHFLLQIAQFINYIENKYKIELIKHNNFYIIKRLTDNVIYSRVYTKDINKIKESMETHFINFIEGLKVFYEKNPHKQYNSNDKEISLKQDIYNFIKDSNACKYKLQKWVDMLKTIIDRNVSLIMKKLTKDFDEFIKDDFVDNYNKPIDLFSYQTDTNKRNSRLTGSDDILTYILDCNLTLTYTSPILTKNTNKSTENNNNFKIEHYNFEKQHFELLFTTIINKKIYTIFQINNDKEINSKVRTLCYFKGYAYKSNTSTNKLGVDAESIIEQSSRIDNIDMFGLQDGEPPENNDSIARHYFNARNKLKRYEEANNIKLYSYMLIKNTLSKTMQNEHQKKLREKFDSFKDNGDIEFNLNDETNKNKIKYKPSGLLFTSNEFILEYFDENWYLLADQNKSNVEIEMNTKNKDIEKLKEYFLTMFSIDEVKDNSKKEQSAYRIRR